MQINKKGFLLILAIFFCINLPLKAYGQENPNYDIQQVEIQADITAEGDLLVKENYTYQIDQLNGIYHEVDLREVELGKYRVGLIHPETGELDYFEESTSHLPRTFHTNIEDDLLRFTVYYPSQEETLNFVFEYTLKSLIVNYSDTAELNRKILGSGTNEEMSVDLTVILPGKVERKEDFRAWLYGDPNGEISLDLSGPQSKIQVQVPNQAANQFLEVHAIFPTSLTPNNKNQLDQSAKEAIIKAGNQRVEEDRSQYQQAKIFDWLKTIGFILIGPLVTLYAYIYYFSNKKCLNPSPKAVPEHVFQLPEEISPAIMAAAYLNRPVNADDFSATIVDLSRKGYLSLTEENKKQRSGLFNRGESKNIRVHKLKDLDYLSQLQKHEVYVLEYLFAEGRQDFILASLEKNIHEDDEFAKKQNRLWTKFRNYSQVMGQRLMAESLPYRRKANSWASLSIFAAIIMIPIFLFFLETSRVARQYIAYIIVLMLLNFLFALLIRFINRKWPIYTGQEDYMRRMWQSFARMLDDIGQFDMREIASLPLWDEYLVYALSLGVADKLIEAMNQQYGLEELDQLSLPRTFYSNPYLINRTLRTSMTSSLAAARPKPAVNWGSYRGTNIGGFGGGASSGSSGGSGGRGGSGGF